MQIQLELPKKVIKINETDYELWFEFVVNLVKEGKISLGKAAELLGISKIKLMEEIAKRKIEIYTKEDLEEDLKILGEIT